MNQFKFMSEDKRLMDFIIQGRMTAHTGEYLDFAMPQVKTFYWNERL